MQNVLKTERAGSPVGTQTWTRQWSQRPDQRWRAFTLLAAGFLLGTSFLTFVFLGTLYMQQVLGFSALAAGAAWMTASVTSLLFGGLSQKTVTRTSPKAVMTVGMTLIGAAILWATQAPANGNFWSDLAGPFVLGGIGTAFAFIPISIGALTGVTEQDAGVASGLLNTSQNLGSVIGVAVASSIAASQFHHGVATAAALTGGLHLALWVCGLSALVAVPMARLVIRRTTDPTTRVMPELTRVAMAAAAE
jgi:MFS family permease